MDQKEGGSSSLTWRMNILKGQLAQAFVKWCSLDTIKQDVISKATATLSLNLRLLVTVNFRFAIMIVSNLLCKQKKQINLD